MADATIEAKLKFLHVSGQFYSATAPATSAQLMLQYHTEIAGTARLTSNDGSKSSCKACGTVLLPGWTSQTSRVDRRASKTANPKPGSRKHITGQFSAHAEKSVRVKCLACHRFEDTPLQNIITRRSSERAKTQLQMTSRLDAKPNPDPESSLLEKSTKASRRRERTRKHNSGLQAMLEKSKAPATPSLGLGLDLMDLMKQV